MVLFQIVYEASAQKWHHCLVEEHILHLTGSESPVSPGRNPITYLAIAGNIDAFVRKVAIQSGLPA